MKEDILKCICILLKRFIASEDVAAAGKLFCMHGILSEGQRKKFRGSTDQTFSKLYSCVQNKSDETFLNTIKDKDFPIDGEVLNVIDFLLAFEKAGWLLMIKTWDGGGLAHFKKELKPLAGAAAAKEKDWFKPLLLMAFNEDILDEEERPVYDAIMSKIPTASPEKSEQTPAKSQHDEASSVDESSKASRTKPAKRKAKKKDRQTGKGKVAKKTDSSDNKHIPSEQGDGETTNTVKNEENTIEGLGMKSSGDRSNETDSENNPKPDDKNIPPNKNETSTDDLKNTSNSKRNQNDKNETDTNDQKNTSNEKRNQNDESKSSRNLRSDSGKGRTPNFDANNVSSKRNGESIDDKKKASNVKANQDESSSSGTIATLARNNIWPEVISHEQRFLEIRAIVSRDLILPPDKGLCMIFEDNGFKPVNMAYNSRKEFFYLRVYCPADYQRYFIYKFCYRKNDGLEYENLPGYGYVDRAIDIREVNTPWLVVLNVCTFRERFGWENYCVKELELLLPTPDFVYAGFHDENDTSALTDVFCWLNCARYGWTLIHRRDWTWGYYPEKFIYQETLTKWLMNLLSNLEENRNLPNLKSVITMALVVALSIHKENIRCKNLSIVLFQMLQIGELDNDESKEFLNQILSLSKYYESIGCPFPRFQDALTWLYQSIPEAPNFEWIPTLPLYWLIVNRGIKQQFTVNSGGDFIHDRSCLPHFKTDFWDRVRRSCMTASVIRKEILDKIPVVLKLYELHPWITGTFQFMLNTKELAHLVSKEHEIVKYFQVDAVLSKYLDGCYHRTGMTMSKEEHASFDKYFNKMLQNSISSINHPETSDDITKCDVEACLNMMTVVSEYSGKCNSSADIFWYVDNILQKTVEMLDLNELNDTQKKKVTISFTKFLRRVTARINQRSVNEQEVQFWDRLLCTSWQLQDISEQWKRELENEMKNAINNFCKNVEVSDKFLEFYATTLENMELKSDVRKYFDDKAFQVADSIMQKPQQVSYILIV